MRGFAESPRLVLHLRWWSCFLVYLAKPWECMLHPPRGSQALVTGPLVTGVWQNTNNRKREDKSLEDCLFYADFPVWKIRWLATNCLCAKALGSVANKSNGQCVCSKQTRQLMRAADPYDQNAGHVRWLLFSSTSAGFSCEHNVWPAERKAAKAEPQVAMTWQVIKQQLFEHRKRGTGFSVWVSMPTDSTKSFSLET